MPELVAVSSHVDVDDRSRPKVGRTAGYKRVASYADLDLNEGKVYRAAGFDPVGEPEVVVGKDLSGDDTEWTRQKYVAELNPEKYAHKPES